MQTWDDMLWLYTHPIFLAMLLFGLALKPLLMYLRRFYPQSWQKAIDESEAYREELAKNPQDTELLKRTYQFEASLIFFPATIAILLYVVYFYINGIDITPILIKYSLISVFAPILFITIGIGIIKHDTMMRYKLKDDYIRYKTITDKAKRFDLFPKFLEKYNNLFGYFSILLGLCAIYVANS